MQIQPILTILLTLSILAMPSYQADCNSTHFEYFSNFSLGKQGITRNQHLIKSSP